VLVAATVLSCDGGAAPAVPELIGTWEWVGTSGGIAGDSRLPGPDDPRVTVEFSTDGTATFRRDGEVAREQRYRLASEGTIFASEDQPVLYFDAEDLGRVVRIDETGRTLTLSDNVYDGFSLDYRRVLPAAE
jgi:hypothetical protein